MNKNIFIVSILFLFLHVIPAWAAAASPMAHDQPIEVSSDKLDVLQNDHKAIFTGNVIAVQGTSTLRAEQMTVFYAADDAKPAAGAQGITRIEAQNNVVFITPTETAQGDFGVYNVDTNTIDLIGKTVTLTRDKNVLKGTKLNYNMDTGRSVLTAGGGTTNVTGAVGSRPSRVHGLFVPNSDKPKSDAKTGAQ